MYTRAFQGTSMNVSTELHVPSKACASYRSRTTCLQAADRVIQYLYGTKSLAIEFSRDSEAFICASDAAFADNVDRKSTEGYLFKLFGGPIDWRACKQKTVATSTTEAELLALSHTTKDYFWRETLFPVQGTGDPLLDAVKPT
jgi:hypothetical protein